MTGVSALSSQSLWPTGGTVTYLPDHEPALGVGDFPGDPEWMSGFDLASGVDLLIHDAQYTLAEYPDRIGWGHSAISDALVFAEATGVKRLVLFHHDPTHSDAMLDQLFEEVRKSNTLPFEMIPAVEGESFQVGKPA